MWITSRKLNRRAPTKTLALRAGARLRLLLLILVEGAEHVTTLGAVKLDHEKLRQDATAA